MISKYISLVAVLMLFAIHPVFADKAIQTSESWSVFSKSCPSEAHTQADMNECAGSKVDKAQAELDEEFANIKARHADDPEKLKKIEKAQNAWQEFMRAQLDLLYFNHTGSVAPMCAANEAAYLIHARTSQLKKWVQDNVEYNACGGL